MGNSGRKEEEYGMVEDGCESGKEKEEDEKNEEEQSNHETLSGKVKRVITGVRPSRFFDEDCHRGMKFADESLVAKKGGILMRPVILILMRIYVCHSRASPACHGTASGSAVCSSVAHPCTVNSSPVTWDQFYHRVCTPSHVFFSCSFFYFIAIKFATLLETV
ncbi:hypothetical protein PoB_003036700 [Plakobranchus ocellatus]|uniref:Uncharacterized protein n=1 Tax=Plakobranchus ocellatus TaxID=259542 RepID=A0AAV4A9I0_9GAST|nr:hypothetical protein PoB_003036700 [Plakobranchus ocellatus]